MDFPNEVSRHPNAPDGQKRAREDRTSRGRGSSESRGSRGGREKRGDMGRGEWSRNRVDKRAQIEKSHEGAKRRRLDGEKDPPVYATHFSKEELEAETKKPKRKVAVMIGYAGTGYRGLQLSHREKTIEGDLFKAFVGAAAISKANADDPKKVSLVRCARTDKGVHAAGNVLSLKLIVEDENIVEKINQHLCPQIRVYGVERTNGSFSAYQFCDSRIYEYLIPTHSFLPPHKDSYLGHKIEQLAEEANDAEAYRERQSEVASFWTEAEETYIKPILDQMDPNIRPKVQKALYDVDVKKAEEADASKTSDQVMTKSSSTSEPKTEPIVEVKGLASSTAIITDSEAHAKTPEAEVGVLIFGPSVNPPPSDQGDQKTSGTHTAPSEAQARELSPLEIAIRQLKAAYITAKKAYRIDPRRLDRVRSTLSRFNGTHNFHNYTIDKAPRDPSAKRVIKSFSVAADPIIVNGTEWLSLKVHGQSFMMHQIRKMVSMVALIIRCGCHEGRIQDSYLAQRLSIPKAPSLGLLLERPVFDAYNEKLVGFGREAIDFKRYEKEMGEFKQREIYDRIFREEEQHNQFHSFFAAMDNVKNSRLLYLSSVGAEAVEKEDLPSTKSQHVRETVLEEASSYEATSGAEDG